MSSATKIPDIIKNREAVGNAVVLGGLGAATAYGLYVVMPYVVTTLGLIQTGLFRMLAIGGMAVVGAFVITNLGTILRFGKVLARAATRQFVAIDPIGFMEEIMESLEERMTMVREKVGALKAAKTEVETEERALNEAIADIKRKANVVEDAKQAEFLGRDLDRKERSLAAVQQRLTLLREYEKALKEVREIGEIRMQDLTSELEEAKRSWRLSKSTSGLAEDMRSLLNPGNDDVQWGTALMEVNSSIGETFASLDLLIEDMQETISNRRLDGSVAVARIAELRQQAQPVKARVADPATTTAYTDSAEFRMPLPPVDTKSIKLGR